MSYAHETNGIKEESTWKLAGWSPSTGTGREFIAEDELAPKAAAAADGRRDEEKKRGEETMSEEATDGWEGG